MPSCVQMRRVTVYCGSNPGARPSYAEAATALGTLLAHEGIGLVYGGAAVGLMGRLADAALAAGGEVIGVLPEGLPREIAHAGLTELRHVTSMHERKSQMVTLADGFIALPGGFGTLEELCETFTWLLLGFHEKPCVLLDVDGYWGPIVTMANRMADERFLHAAQRDMLLSATTPREALDALRRFEFVRVHKWLDP